MHYLIQHAKARQQAISVPDGLPELLSDITREVLRCQPTKDCLCQFIIDYLHSVIVAREKAMVAKSVLDRALRQVDSIISDLCVCDLSKEKSDEMAQVMEDCFRNFLEKRRCEMRRGKETIKFADIDMFEELIKKCHFSEQELDSSRPAIESAYNRFVDAYMAAGKDAHGTELLYEYFRDRELKRIKEELQNKAATTIQAAFRGYLVRNMLSQHVCVCTCLLDEQNENLIQLMDKAARIIQRFFRAAMNRHDLKAMEDPCQEKETPYSKDETSWGPVVDAAPASTAGTAVDTVFDTPAATLAPSEAALAPAQKESVAETAQAAVATEGASIVPAASAEPAAKTEEPKAEEPAEASPEPAAAPAEEAAAPPTEESAAPPAEEAPPPPAEEATLPAEEAPPAEESPPAEEAPPAE